MKNIFLLIQFISFFLYITPQVSVAQNLVPNPSFEDTVSCPDGLSQSHLAAGWSTNINTVDFFHFCSNHPSSSVPSNGFGYQCPSSGNGYFGFYNYIINPFSKKDTREYFGTKLLSPLIPNTKYYVSFKLSLHNGLGCATNKIGMLLFTNFSLNDTGIVPAPFVNNFANVYTSDIYSDTLGWSTFSGSFIADSSYQYLLMGNFFDKNNFDSISFGGGNCMSYYYIEDICISSDSLTCTNIKNQITDLTADSIDLINGSCINFSINTNVNYSSYQWIFEGGNPSVFYGNVPTNICYDTVGNYSVTLIALGSTGCADTTTKLNYISVQQNVSTKENISEKSKLLIYPNPVNDKTILPADFIHAKVFSVMGQFVYEIYSNQSIPITMDLSFLTQSVYFIELETSNHNKIFSKIIVNK